jgi:hypothetical protein
MLYRIDGWDYYPANTGVSANALADGWFGSTTVLSTSTGRFASTGGLAMGSTGLNFSRSMFEGIGRRYTTETVVVGQALFIASSGGLISPFNIGLYDGQGGNALQSWLQFEEDGVIRLYRGGLSSTNSGGSTVIATTPAKTVHSDEWNYIEIKVKVHPTAGIFEVRVNTVVVISYFGNTQNLMPPILGQDPGWDTLCYEWRGAFSATWWDDRYILDDTGTVNTTYLGNVRVNTQLSIGVGDETDMSVFGAAANWDAVNEALLTEVEYVYSATMGDFDLYEMDPNVTAQNILGVQVVGAHRQDDSTQLKSNLLLKTGGTVYPGADHYLAQTYHYYRDMWDLSPGTGVGWTTAELNAIQPGQKVLLG